MSLSLKNFPQRLLLIGCGNMAGAMLLRWLDSGLDPKLVTVVRPSGPAVADGVRVVEQVPTDQPPADIVMLGVKPQQLGAIADDVAAAIRSQTILLSILAGVSLLDLAERFPGQTIIRAMPNMPVRSGNGVVLLAGDPDPQINQLMKVLGHCQWLEDETSFDLYTALAGSGPAFVYRMIEAMAAAGVRLGLPHEEALALTRAVFTGASLNTMQSAMTPGELASQVASKGGMTQAGLDVMDEDGKLVALMTDVLRAARDRSKELAEAARA